MKFIKITKLNKIKFIFVLKSLKNQYFNIKLLCINMDTFFVLLILFRNIKNIKIINHKY